MNEAARGRIVDIASRLAREKLAPRAARYDREAANPVDSWRDLHADGILAAAIPAAHGGLGLDMPAYVDVIRTLAQGCASTAMTLHMHSTVMRFIDALGTEAQKRRWFAEVVGGGTLFGSWGSEPAVSLSRTLLMETAIRADGGTPGRHAPAGVDLVQLDHVPERIVEEDLLGLGPDHALGYPVLDAEPVQLPAGLLDVGDGERHVRQ